MRPRRATAVEVARWSLESGRPVVQAMLGGADEGEGVLPCPTMVTAGMCRVAYQLDPLEPVRLAEGGTLWLTTWGILPVHLLEVR